MCICKITNAHFYVDILCIMITKVWICGCTMDTQQFYLVLKDFFISFQSLLHFGEKEKKRNMNEAICQIPFANHLRCFLIESWEKSKVSNGINLVRSFCLSSHYLFPCSKVSYVQTQWKHCKHVNETENLYIRPNMIMPSISTLLTHPSL